MAEPLMTVLLPVRDEERYIGSALRSIMRQSLRGIDILVVDDGSSDRTVDIVRGLACQDQRIRLLHNADHGFAQALNFGLEHARSDLVARMDADDVALPTRLAHQLLELRANPAAVAVGTYGLRVNEWGVPIGRLRVGPAGRSGYEQCMRKGETITLTHPSVALRRSAVLAVGGYEGDYYPAEDYRLWNRLALDGEVYALPRLLTLYRIRSSGMSADQTLLMERNTARIQQEIGATGGMGSGDGLDDVERSVTRRQFARALVNGKFLRAARLAHRLDGQMVREVLRKSLRG